MTTVHEILDAVMKELFANEDITKLNDVRAVIPYPLFVRIMCAPEKPLFISRRTIREKWHLLHDLGYFTQVNQHASRVNVGLIVRDFYRE